MGAYLGVVVERRRSIVVFVDRPHCGDLQMENINLTSYLYKKTTMIAWSQNDTVRQSRDVKQQAL